LVLFRKVGVILLDEKEMDSRTKKIHVKDDIYTMVDSEDYDYLSRFNWFLSKRGYVVHHNGNTTTSMHRMITNPPQDMTVDHKDNCKLNNKRDNLRICTQAQNNYNKPPLKRTSKYKGVIKRENTWIAQIQVEGKIIHIGTFVSEIASACAYNHYAKKYFGEYAWLNDVPDNVDWRAYESIVYTSKLRGVSWAKANGKWRAVIHHNKKQYSLGLFSSEEDAGKAYDKKAIELKGSKAKLNFPEVNHDERL
jgi:hypothetical protein